MANLNNNFKASKMRPNFFKLIKNKLTTPKPTASSATTNSASHYYAMRQALKNDKTVSASLNPILNKVKKEKTNIKSLGEAEEMTNCLLKNAFAQLEDLADEIVETTSLTDFNDNVVEEISTYVNKIAENCETKISGNIIKAINKNMDSVTAEKETQKLNSDEDSTSKLKQVVLKGSLSKYLENLQSDKSTAKLRKLGKETETTRQGNVSNNQGRNNGNNNNQNPRGIRRQIDTIYEEDGTEFDEESTTINEGTTTNDDEDTKESEENKENMSSEKSKFVKNGESAKSDKIIDKEDKSDEEIRNLIKQEINDKLTQLQKQNKLNKKEVKKSVRDTLVKRHKRELNDIKNSLMKQIAADLNLIYEQQDPPLPEGTTPKEYHSPIDMPCHSDGQTQTFDIETDTSIDVSPQLLSEHPAEYNKRIDIKALQKYAHKQKWIKSYSKLAYHLRIKYHMSVRNYTTYTYMKQDARTWMLKNGFTCDTQFDYTFMVSCVNAAFVIQDEEIITREMVKNNINLPAMEKINDFCAGDLGFLPREGIFPCLKPKTRVTFGNKVAKIV